MDDIFTGQSVCLGNLCLTCPAAVQRPALCQKLWPGGSVYGSIHATTAKQALIGGIDNGIGIMFCRNVSQFRPYNSHVAILPLLLISVSANTPVQLSTPLLLSAVLPDRHRHQRKYASDKFPFQMVKFMLDDFCLKAGKLTLFFMPVHIPVFDFNPVMAFHFTLTRNRKAPL